MTRPPVTLPLTEARCPESRAKPCSQAHGCARALVAADRGRPLHDYSVDRNPWLGCPGYLPASACRMSKQPGRLCMTRRGGWCDNGIRNDCNNEQE